MRTRSTTFAGTLGAAIFATAIRHDEPGHLLIEEDKERRKEFPRPPVVFNGEELDSYEEPHPPLVMTIKMRKEPQVLSVLAFAAAVSAGQSLAAQGVRFHPRYDPLSWTRRAGDWAEAEAKRIRKAEKKARDIARTLEGKAK